LIAGAFPIAFSDKRLFIFYTHTHTHTPVTVSCTRHVFKVRSGEPLKITHKR